MSGVTASHGRITSGEGIISRQDIYKYTLNKIDERRRLSDERIDESAWAARPPSKEYTLLSIRNEHMVSSHLRFII
jgi:hypothetical protein